MTQMRMMILMMQSRTHSLAHSLTRSLAHALAHALRWAWQEEELTLFVDRHGVPFVNMQMLGLRDVRDVTSGPSQYM